MCDSHELLVVFFLFKQKTAYEMRISDWSSDVCSADLQTTDKLLLVSTNGRFYTLGADKLPGGRGFGEPVRLMVDVENDSEILALLPARTGGKLLLTADDGRGFVANIDEITAETRKGRQVVNLKPQSKLKIVRPIPANADFI